MHHSVPASVGGLLCFRFLATYTYMLLKLKIRPLHIPSLSSLCWRATNKPRKGQGKKKYGGKVDRYASRATLTSDHLINLPPFVLRRKIRWIPRGGTHVDNTARIAVGSFGQKSVGSFVYSVHRRVSSPSQQGPTRQDPQRLSFLTV